MAESQANPQPLARPSPRYLAQVKAFLSYIEDVEVDEETIEDIFTGLEGEFEPSATSDGEQSGAESNTPNRSGVDGDPSEEEDEFAQEGLVQFDANQPSEGLIYLVVCLQLAMRGPKKRSGR